MQVRLMTIIISSFLLFPKEYIVVSEHLTTLSDIGKTVGLKNKSGNN